MTRAPRTVLVLLVTVLLQEFVASSVTIASVRLDLLVVVAAAAGLSGGPDRGAVVGFAAGLLTDLTIDGPFGLSALLYAVAASTLGSVQRSFVGPSWWVGPIGVGLASGFTVIGYVAIGAVLGHPEWVNPHALTVLLVVSVGAALLAPLAIRIMAWTEGEPLGLALPSWLPRRRPRRSGRPTVFSR